MTFVAPNLNHLSPLYIHIPFIPRPTTIKSLRPHHHHHLSLNFPQIQSIPFSPKSMESNDPTTAAAASSSAALPLQDRVAIVTGASRGIGKAIALHLASLGAKLVVNYTSDSSQPQAQDVVSQINSLFPASTPRAVAVQADVSDPAQVTALFDAAEQAFASPLHIVIANAAVTNTKFPTIADTDVADFDRVFAVNVRGTFLCIKEAARRVKKGGGGRIVTVSTSLVAAVVARSGAYTPSKAAVEAMTKILAKELRGTGITANCVAPGPVATDMFYVGKTAERVEEVRKQSPLERLGKAEDVAPVVGWLASDAGEWINGQVVRVNGGAICG